MWFIGIVVIIVVIVVLVRRSGPSQAEREERAGAQLAQEVGGKHLGGTMVEVERKVVRLASDGRIGVAGEHYSLSAIKKVVGRRRVGSVGDWDEGLESLAYLVREPKNRHDPNAVLVTMQADGAAIKVGYLPADVAPAWQPLLFELEARGVIAEVVARVYRSGSEFQIVLHASDPDNATFCNEEPEGATILPAQRQCAVTGEKEHQDFLANFDGNTWATLHPGVVPSGKYAGQDTIEVRIDGQVVGTLTGPQGERYLPLLDEGDVVGVEAEVYQGSKIREVRLMLPKVD